jgi:4-amino-4-deoxy-L-arabinose transferase-like glycosyltransferase
VTNRAINPGMNGNDAHTAWWSRPLVIMSVALLARLAWALLVPVDPVSDGVVYDAFARSIVSGHGYAFPDGTLTEYWPVGTSAVYGLLYTLFGIRLWVVALFQALIGALVVGLTWRLANDAFGRTVAATAAWLTAVWPVLIEFTTVLASELLFITLLLTALNVWISRGLRFPVRLALWGACIAAAAYVRPTALPLLLLFPLLQWLFDRDGRVLLTGGLVAGLIAALLLAPWSYRSLVRFDRFALVAANGGVNLWMGNNPDSSGGYMQLPARLFPNEVDRDHYYGNEALRFIRSHPLAYLRLCVRRTVTTFDRETIGVVWNEHSLSAGAGTAAVRGLKQLSSAYWWLLLALGALGVAGALRDRPLKRFWPQLATLAYFTAFPILTVAMDRYHLPVDPILAIFAAYALLEMRERSGAMFRLRGHSTL